MQVLTTASEHDPKPVWELLKGLGVGHRAVEWSRSFGTDLRRFWGACEHGELMIGLAVQTGVPAVLTTLAMMECLESSLPDSAVPDELSEMLWTVDGWLVSELDDGDVSEALGGLDVAVEHIDQERDLVSFQSAMAGQALGLSILHIDHACHWQRKSSVDVMRHAAELRIAIVRQQGETCAQALRDEGFQSLHEFSDVVRHYVPIELITMSWFANAISDEMPLALA